MPFMRAGRGAWHPAAPSVRGDARPVGGISTWHPRRDRDPYTAEHGLTIGRREPRLALAASTRHTRHTKRTTARRAQCISAGARGSRGCADCRCGTRSRIGGPGASAQRTRGPAPRARSKARAEAVFAALIWLHSAAARRNEAVLKFTRTTLPQASCRPLHAARRDDPAACTNHLRAVRARPRTRRAARDRRRRPRARRGHRARRPDGAA